MAEKSKFIKMTVDDSDFQKNVKRLQEELPEQFKKILIDSSPQFVKAAQKYTPPSLGRASIQKKFYTRPIIFLLNLVRFGRVGRFQCTPKDIQMFRKGYKYKVINTRNGGTKKAIGYTKTQGQAKKMAKIQTRGLMRAMWGKTLNKIGAKIPNSIASLLRKGKRLSSINLSDTKLKKKDTITQVQITNKAAESQRFVSIAISRGLKAVQRFIVRQLKKIVNKDIQL